MRRLISTLLIFPCVFFSSLCLSQGAWNQKNNFGGPVRNGAVGFSIGAKGYIGTGQDGSLRNDFWEWDQGSDTWTQKANFGGTSRRNAVGFSIGTKGYVGTGFDAVGNRKDFWEWDQGTNSWTQKADFGGLPRSLANGFSIGSKGYIGAGGYSDFWEWDQGSNTWAQKSNIPMNPRTWAVGFSIGPRGYLATGQIGGNYMKDLWEWDQGSDAWTQMADFGGTARGQAVGFSIGTKGYVGSGFDFKFFTKQDFWEWDQTSNTWIQIAGLVVPKSNAVGFSIGNRGYIGTGSDGMYPFTNDFWEWDPNCSLNITGNTYTLTCGTSISLTANYVPTSSHIVYSWTPSSGLNNTTIANPIVSPTATTTYILVAQDTVTHCTGTASYYVYVSPATCTISGPGPICFGANASLSSSFSPSSGNMIYNWTPSSGLNNTSVANPVATPSTTTCYTLTAQDVSSQCTKSSTFTVNISHGLASIGGPYEICKGQSIVLFDPYGEPSYSWSSGQTTNPITVSPSVNTMYIVDAVNQYGCHGYDTASVAVNCFGTSTCNNMDFEEGNFNNWTGLLGGNYSSANPPTVITVNPGFHSVGNNSPVNSLAQHTINSVSMVDTLAIDTASNLPDPLMTTLAPSGGNYSVRLGNAWVGAQAEGLRLFFASTTQNSIFSYQFASLFQDAGHLRHKNPGLMINVYDSNGVLIPGLCDTIHASDPGYQFRRSPYKSGFLFYKHWSTENINLSSYVGQMVRVDFINFDCSEGYHWGYTYLDVTCSGAVGISQLSNFETVSISPNPSSGLFTIKSEKEISQIEILNVLGEKVYSASNNLHLTTYRIDMGKQPKGVYFYKAGFEDGNILTGKIIIE